MPFDLTNVIDGAHRLDARILGGIAVAVLGLLYQSVMRPTKGEIRNMPASAHATACAMENSAGVRLQSMPLQDLGGADAPQVEASLIRMRSMPRAA